MSNSNHSLGPCMRHEKGAAALWRHFGLDLRSLAMIRILLGLDLVAAGLELVAAGLEILDLGVPPPPKKKELKGVGGWW